MQYTEMNIHQLFNLSNTHSIGNHYMAELRDADIQKDSLRFRKNLERLGECLGFELSKSLKYVIKPVQTPLGTAQCQVLEEQPVLGSILRAGVPLHTGLLNVFDRAGSCFIGSYRKVRKSGNFVIQMDYVSAPDLNNKVLIMCDPMLATGQSMVVCCKELMSAFSIKEIHVVSAIASTEGIDHVRANIPNVKIWVGAVDQEMTTKAYIVPGLGDAGDLAYGEKR